MRSKVSPAGVISPVVGTGMHLSCQRKSTRRLSAQTGKVSRSESRVFRILKTEQIRKFDFIYWCNECKLFLLSSDVKKG